MPWRRDWLPTPVFLDFPGAQTVNNLPALCLGSISGLRRSPGGGLGTHSSIFVWRIPMDRGAWWATVHGVSKELNMIERLSIAPCSIHHDFFFFACMHACNYYTAEQFPVLYLVSPITLLGLDRKYNGCWLTDRISVKKNDLYIL